LVFGRRETGFRLVLIAAAVLLTALGLELALRVQAAYQNRKLLQRALERPPDIPADRQVELGHIVRLSPNPRLVYELVPNLEVLFRGQWTTLNASGFRGPELREAKGPGVVRIVGLGDSVMFGWGVSDGKEYLARLAEQLNRVHKERRWEVANLAVPGYNTVMEVETLRTKGLRLSPDLVVLGYCGNDLNLPSFIRDERDPWSLRESFLAGLVRARLARVSGERDPSGLTKGEGAEELRGFEDDPGRVPRAYADMVGRDAFVRALRELEALSREHGFEVLIVAYPTVPPSVRPTLEAQKLPVLDTADLVRAFLRGHGGGPFKGSALTLGEDPHPSPEGHELIADALLDRLSASGFVARQLARP
jgi:lysophospholipase L1-like esterase